MPRVRSRVAEWHGGLVGGERGWLARRALAGIGSLALLVAAGPALATPVKAYRDRIELPTYPWAAVRHPYFRATDRVNIYPYPMLDFLSRERELRTYATVVLENEYLRVTFLPELGGKVHEVIDKTTGQPMFYVNHVVKPGLIGMCGAWTSGGIEWNTGPQGHTVSAMQPVEVVILPAAPDGARSVAVGETERIYGTRWTVVVTLRPGRAFLEEQIRIYNPTPQIRPYYFWNCTAVPNTPGFRFIYPMTLGCDHGAEKFFRWPIHDGKDLSRGTNYVDASSIFAWHCDQDFFGSYDDGADRGVVAYANHHQLPGKKAWTWGYGGFGHMHQMDLTDDDGPYNEVQTGPLLTQADVGQLDPHEAVSWQEWWYPIRGLGGFTHANRDVAANATLEDGQLRLRLISTAVFRPVTINVSRDTRILASAKCKLTPGLPVDLRLAVASAPPPILVTLTTRDQVLARFTVPLPLPQREPPGPKAAPATATELAQAGSQDYLFARFPEAEAHYRQALERDPRSVPALTGLAVLQIDRDPSAAAASARAALRTDPNDGAALMVLATAEDRSGNQIAALEHAWKAALDPATAIPGRALAAAILLRQQDWARAAAWLAEPGPWEHDLVCRSRRALAAWRLGDRKQAIRLAEANLQVDPLDSFARALLWLSDAEGVKWRLRDQLEGTPAAILELVSELARLAQDDLALRVLRTFYLEDVSGRAPEPLPLYWAAYVAERTGRAEAAVRWRQAGRAATASSLLPHHLESVPVLRWALDQDPADGKAALYLGHLLFHLGRHAEGQAFWQQAAKLGTEPVLATRALGMAALNLAGAPGQAADLLRQAHQFDPADPIVARDLARVLFTLAGSEPDAARARALLLEARDVLQPAFAAGKGRSDFVTLLARAQNRLGQFAETARMLEGVRVTVWEGSREVHDLYEESHLALGDAHLQAGRAAEALREFDRALDYPANLATGRLENTREAHIQYRRGNAFAVLQQTENALAAWRQAAQEPESKDADKEEARRKAREALERPRPK